ncbi:murein biosynthesis integral membrane protein MurJ [[Clostridium] dakarense]|uniref:murein biosynthesis integral membrane protein MurJ n=1 Tax=Faecalimicrobium dakarense TaxID=1301100 RepID=UPI0004B36620|nr:murein biosynthesis integral membrane protein MurJ [[Clostridium] dakarense]
MSKVAKATIGLMIVTMLSKCLGFGRELVLGAAYGATSYSDVYITAMNIPITLFSVIGTGLATTFIPLYYENRTLGGEEKGIKFINNTLNIVLVLGSLMAILGMIFTEPLVKLFAIGFEAEQFKMAVQFTRIMMFGGLFLAVTKIMSSYLQTKENFIIPGLVGVPYNIIIITSIILSVKTNIYVLAIGTLLAMGSQFLFQVPFAAKKGYKYKPILNLKDEYVKKMIWLVGPVFIGVFVNQMNAVVDRTLASTLAEGSISALNYANRLNGFVMGLFIATLGAVIYPMLSKLSSEKNDEKFTESVVSSVNSVVLLVVPISVGAMVLSTPIVKLLFERGAFDERATAMTSIALVFYSIGMVAFGLRDILGKVFYSLQDTKTPMINGAIAMSMNIVLNLMLVKFMGHAGLAFATSISALICTFLLFNSLKKRIGYFGQDKIIKSTIKSLIASIIMGIAALITNKLLSSLLGVGFMSNVISLFGAIIAGVVVYGLLVVILKVEEVKIITDLIRKRLKR